MRLILSIAIAVLPLVTFGQIPFSLQDRAFVAKSSNLLPKLNAYWRFEELSGVRYASISANHLNPTNTPGVNTGSVGNAITMSSASSQYAGCAANSALAFGDSDFTISAWPYLTSKANQCAIVSKYQSTGNKREYLLYFDQTADRFRFLVSTNGTAAGSTIVSADNFGSPSLNTFYSVVATHNSVSNTLSIWVNTVGNQVTHTTGCTNAGAPFLVGALNPDSPTSFMNGRIDEVGIWSRALSLTDITNLATACTFPRFKNGIVASTPNGSTPVWGTNGLTGTYALASTVDTTAVLAPNGDTPTEGSLASHRYHHHAKIFSDSGVTFLAFSSGGTNEDADGQQVAMCYSTDKGVTWSAPSLVVASQGTFSGTGAYGVPGAKVTYPRSFYKYNGVIYLISAVDEFSAASARIGKTLLARQVNLDGTLGTLFRITPGAYTPPSGTINYDSNLGPPLLAYTEVYGPFGGSAPGEPASEFQGWVQQAGVDYAEPATTLFDNTGRSLVRYWRRVTTPNNKIYVSHSQDFGITWDSLAITSVPDSPSKTMTLKLSTGEYAVIGNPVDASVSRDPLYLAILNPWFTVTTVVAIRQGLSGTPTYAGTHKGGGAQYPDAVQNGNYLYVAYSTQKETVAFSRVLIPGLADNDNDT